MFHIIKGDIDQLSHVYEAGLSTEHYIKITNDISSFDFVGCTSANGLLSSMVTVAMIGDKVVELQPSCFLGCIELSGVNSSTSLTSVGDSCFENCTSLAWFDSLMLGQVSYIGDRCFYNTGFENITLSVNGSNIQIGPLAFAQCSNLKSVVFSGITYFSNYMFSGCRNLEYCQPSQTVRNIGSYAFDGCTSLAAFKVPNGMTTIPTGFFNGCQSLQICDFESYSSSGLQSVSDYAFNGCMSLATLTLPSSINSIGKISSNAFAGSSLTTITFKGLSDNDLNGFGSSGKKYSTGTLYSTSDGTDDIIKIIYAVIDQAIESNTPVIVFLADTNAPKNAEKNRSLRLAALLNYMYMSNWLPSQGQAYYYIYANRNDSELNYNDILQHPVLSEIMQKKRFTKDTTWVKLGTDGVNGTDGCPYIITIWNKTAQQAGGEALAGTYFTKKGYNYHLPITTNFNTEKDSEIKAAAKKLASYFNSILPNTFVAPEEHDDQLSESITGWGLDHTCTLISNSGTEFIFTPGGGIKEDTGIEVDTDTETGFKFGKWYGNIEALANYVESVNLSGYALDKTSYKDVPKEERVGLIIVGTSRDRNSAGTDNYSTFYNYVFNTARFQDTMKSSCCLLGYYDGDNWSSIEKLLHSNTPKFRFLKTSYSLKDCRPCIIYMKDGQFLYNDKKYLTSNYCEYLHIAGNEVAKSKKATSQAGTPSVEAVISALPSAFGGSQRPIPSASQKALLQQSAHSKYL